MFYQIKKIASFSLAASLGLTIAANKAQALTFGVSYGVLNDTHTAEGSIQVKDSSLSSNATNLIESDFEDWEIAITNDSKGVTTTLTPANSSIHSFPDSPSGIMGTEDEVIFSNEEEFRIGIDYDDMIRLTSEGRGVHLEGTEIFVPMNQDSLVALPNLASTNSGRGTTVSVPFGVSSNTGILILGGLYGASRLRKKLLRNG